MTGTLESYDAGRIQNSRAEVRLLTTILAWLLQHKHPNGVEVPWDVIHHFEGTTPLPEIKTVESLTRHAMIVYVAREDGQ